MQIWINTKSRGSPSAHAYHVWSTSVSTFVSYPAHRMTERSHHYASLAELQTRHAGCSSLVATWHA